MKVCRNSNIDENSVKGMEESESDLWYDCVIIGAGGSGEILFGPDAHCPSGLYGIAAANAYLSLHPDDRLVILESRSCIGGVWSHGNVQSRYNARLMPS